MEPAAARSPLPQDSFGNIFRACSTIRVVLPDRTGNLEEAAREFVLSLQEDDYQRLDEALQTLVLAPLGGLQPICEKHGDLGRFLTAPLIDQTAAFLSELLPITDVAQAELSAAAHSGRGLNEHLQKIIGRAAPLAITEGFGPAVTYLLHPGSEASQQVAGEAQRILPELQLLAGSSSHDLTFCREQGCLTHSQLENHLPLCRIAYRQITHNPAQSPHARFDVPEWQPLELQ
jgi:hypothetical protein